eukprot:Skav202702  [mRNA]  locus=scaffold654:382043:386629:- [translate_table: standard]
MSSSCWLSTDGLGHFFCAIVFIMLWQTLLLGLLQAAAADESIALVEGKVDLEVDLDGDLEDLGLPKRCNKKKGSKTCCLCGRVSDHNSREELSDIKFLHGWNPELCEEDRSWDSG